MKTPSLTSAARLLVLNAGSSTLKYKVFGVESTRVAAPVFAGLVELSNASNPTGRIVHQCLETHEKQEIKVPLPSHDVALETVVDQFFGGEAEHVRAIGHRVVHGGESFHDATLINEQVLEAVREHTSLAPLHNPGNLIGIDVATKVFGSDCPQVAVFDTAYHATMPPKAYIYGIPYSLYEQHGVRRYGFHGTSHQYVAKQAAKLLNKPMEQCNFVTCHLGNGSSMTAIREGKCIDTTMGMTPLEGLVMGTRSGDLDPAVHAFLASHANMSIEEIDKMLNKQSGLFGICGDSDIRRIQDRIRRENDPIADLALDVYAHRVRKYLGAYILELEGSLDALIFTAGIGENSSMVRERVCRNLGFLGIEIDDEKNTQSTMGAGPMEIQTSQGKIKILVIPTDEERSIAEQTFEIALARAH